jgi:cytochrome c
MPRSPLAPLLLLVATLIPLVGCGGGTSRESTATTPTQRSPLDIGPRAGDSPVAIALAAQGKELFKAKGCTACHAFGKRLTGPDLRGVTRRRTAAWMEQQILHPDIMIHEDPITRDLFAEYNLQMANQGLYPEEAKAVIEYFKQLDDEAEAKGELAAQK